MIAADRAMYRRSAQGKNRVAGSFTARTGSGPDAGDPPAGSDDHRRPTRGARPTARPATDDGRVDGIAVMVPRVVPRPGQTG